MAPRPSPFAQLPAITLAMLAACTVAGAASAAENVIPAADTGAYDHLGFRDPADTEFLCGIANKLGDGREYRNFFVFDLSATTLAGLTLESVHLRVRTDNPNGLIFTFDASENWLIHEVTTPAATVTAGGSGLTSIFDDFGDGPVLGSQNIVASDNALMYEIPLNAAGISAVAAAVGQSFVMGGEVEDLNGNLNTFENVFRFMTLPDAELVVLVCGDGFRDGAEQCDDGNVSPADGCSATCNCEPTPDSDGDGHSNPCDNCPLEANADQADADGDLLGDVCDTCPDDADPLEVDTDGDGTPEVCDTCPDLPNADQADADGDGLGDICDPCTSVGQSSDFVNADMRLRHLTLYGYQDTLRFAGSWELYSGGGFAAIDPLVTPVSLLILNYEGETVVDVDFATTPYAGSGTAGWRVAGGGRKLIYRDRTASPPAGISNLRIEDRSSSNPDEVRVRMTGKGFEYGNGDSALNNRVFTVILTLGDAAAGLCGQIAFAQGECAHPSSMPLDSLNCRH